MPGKSRSYVMRAFWDGFEKRALKIKDSDTWKAKWHPEGKEREAVHKAILSKLKSSKKNLTPEGLEELELVGSGATNSSDSMWHPRFLRTKK
jgi:hypothetical protein